MKGSIKQLQQEVTRKGRVLQYYNGKFQEILDKLAEKTKMLNKECVCTNPIKTVLIEYSDIPKLSFRCANCGGNVSEIGAVLRTNSD